MGDIRISNMKNGGDATPDELKKVFNDYIDYKNKGQNRSKVRFVLE
ncbi:MAG: hypothetical protein PHP13_06450 [Methanomicrobium sp.]|nr:hypothetical protein [Methanomicrobium sp.]